MIWQADGRPMSGDISRGTAHASSQLAAAVLLPPTTDATTTNSAVSTDHSADIGSIAGSDNQISAGAGGLNSNTDAAGINFTIGKHFLQLAGGTNNYSMQAAAQQGLIGKPGFAGFAFGGYARKSIAEYLNVLEDLNPGAKIENHPEYLHKCVKFARELVDTVKAHND